METDLPPEPRPESEPEPAPAAVPPSAPVVDPAPAQFASPIFAADSAVKAAAEVPGPLPYPDRSTGLMIFGVFQIILGLLAALMVPLVALGAFMSAFGPGGAMRPWQYISGMVSYSFLAAGLITLGIGSVRLKRWARALTLVTSWYWLIMGALITVLITAMLPVAMRGALAQAQQNAGGGQSAQVPTGVMAVILTIMIIFAAFFLIVVPIAFVVFYGRNDVAETCRRHDPVERWTDRVPLPVLGASVVLFVGSLYLISTGVTTPVFPFFGKYLNGIGATACFLILAALDIYLAFAIFRLKRSGWWLAILTIPVRLVSMALTYGRADMMQAYSKLGWSSEQMKMLNSNPMFHSHVILWWSLLSLLIFFGYLLWLKRYFTAPAAPGLAVPVSNLPA
jgi:hypothetical protein